MAIIVTGDQKDRISNRIGEVMRQVFLQKEYGHDPERLIEHLQAATEGRFNLAEPTDREQKIFAGWGAKWSEFWDRFGINVRPMLAHENCPKAPQAGFPWVIVDPGVMTDQQLVDTLFKDPTIHHWMSVALGDYSNSGEPKKAHVILARDTIEPDEDYLGKSADDADQITVEKGTQFLLRRHWIILFAFLWWSTEGKQKLDVKGWTRFPKNRLSGGRAALALWGPAGGRVWLHCDSGGRRDDDAGPREGKFYTL